MKSYSAGRFQFYSRKVVHIKLSICLTLIYLLSKILYAQVNSNNMIEMNLLLLIY